VSTQVRLLDKVAQTALGKAPLIMRTQSASDSP
jgi:hypothetical protein